MKDLLSPFYKEISLLKEDSMWWTTNQKQKPRTEMQPGTRKLFLNSARYQSPRPGMTLITADTTSRKRNNNDVGSDRRRGKCEIYVSNLHPDTSTHEVLRYLKANYSGYFKLEQIRNHFNDYSSFKIEAPLTLKSKLLNKYNWNADVYVQPFFKKSRNY